MNNDELVHVMMTRPEWIGVRGRELEFSIPRRFVDIFDGDWESIYFVSFVHAFHNAVMATGNDTTFPSESTFSTVLPNVIRNCCKRLNKDLLLMEQFLRENRRLFPNDDYPMRWVIEQPTDFLLPLQGRVMLSNPQGGEPRITVAKMDTLPERLMQLLKDNRIEIFFERYFQSTVAVQTFWSIVLDQYISNNPMPRRQYVSLTSPTPTPIRIPRHDPQHDLYIHAPSPPPSDRMEGHTPIGGDKGNTAKLPFPPAQPQPEDDIDKLIDEINGLIEEGNEKPPE